MLRVSTQIGNKVHFLAFLQGVMQQKAVSHHFRLQVYQACNTEHCLFAGKFSKFFLIRNSAVFLLINLNFCIFFFFISFPYNYISLLLINHICTGSASNPKQEITTKYNSSKANSYTLIWPYSVCSVHNVYLFFSLVIVSLMEKTVA